jgi:hypothetical protein
MPESGLSGFVRGARGNARPYRDSCQRAYIDNNASGIVNYGERHRCGERISTGFVESTINQLVAKRFVKKQQMRWTPRGAHLLLQIRVQALNDDLRTSFERWYPGLRRRHEETLAA